MKKIYLVVTLGVTAVCTSLYSQNVAINATGAAPNASAMLDISSTTSGLLIPRMTTAQRIAIATPAAGLKVYDATTNTFWYFNGTTWVEQLGSTNGWTLSGNATTATNFIGTTNAQPFRFYCNNIERGRFNPTDGEMVYGATASPYPGDQVSAVATASLTFALNGYCGVANGAGTWGEILNTSNTSFSAVQGVYGGTGAGAGVLGNYAGTSTANTRAGVVGVVTSPTTSNGGCGVYGYNGMTGGSQRIGVIGLYGTGPGLGVVGIGFGGGIMPGSNDVAVVGWRANNMNYSGYFNGNHTIANGTKSASVGTQWGNQLLYCQESPEVWFEDIGGGTLVNGVCHIELDSIFLQATVIDDEHPMRVFIQLEGECEDVFVEKGKTGFTVKEKNGGHSNTSFSYRIVAKRVNFQDHRYGNDPVWGPGDTRAYGQYAPPPPIDYAKNVAFQDSLKQNYKPTPMPEGFIDYFQLQKEAQQLSTSRGQQPQPVERPADTNKQAAPVQGPQEPKN